MIHVNCFMSDNKWYAISVLVGPRLMISACVEDSAGKHISGARLGCRAVGFGRWDGPDYVNLFPPMFTKVFMCVFMAL